VLSLQVGDEPDKAWELACDSSHRREARTNSVEHERDESVITGEWNKVGIDKDNVLEVVDDGFSVQEVIGNGKEVPVG
jgi:hypothetical protein